MAADLYTPGKRAGPLGTLYDRPGFQADHEISPVNNKTSTTNSSSSSTHFTAGRRLLDAFKHKPASAEPSAGSSSNGLQAGNNTSVLEPSAVIEDDGDVFTRPSTSLHRSASQAQSQPNPNKSSSATSPGSNASHRSWFSRLTGLSHKKNSANATASSSSASHFTVYQDTDSSQNPALCFSTEPVQDYEGQENDENAPPSRQSESLTTQSMEGSGSIATGEHSISTAQAFQTGGSSDSAPRRPSPLAQADALATSGENAVESHHHHNNHHQVQPLRLEANSSATEEGPEDDRERKRIRLG